MIINSIAAIYFSPTGTRKKILYAIIHGMGIDNFNHIDITLTKERNGNMPSHVQNVLLGINVYMKMNLKRIREELLGYPQDTMLS